MYLSWCTNIQALFLVPLRLAVAHGLRCQTMFPKISRGTPSRLYSRGVLVRELLYSDGGGCWVLERREKEQDGTGRITCLAELGPRGCTSSASSLVSGCPKLLR